MCLTGVNGRLVQVCLVIYKPTVEAINVQKTD